MQLADLFQLDKSFISRHIRILFDEGELVRGATVARFATVQTEGARALDEAEELHRQIRALFPGRHPDSFAEAELFEEEAEVCAARGRYREAISKARKALREYSAPYFKPWLRAALLRKISRWARAAGALDPPGPPQGSQ